MTATLLQSSLLLFHKPDLYLDSMVQYVNNCRQVPQNLLSQKDTTWLA